MGRELTTTEAAAVLGVSPETLRKMTARGDLPCRRTAGGHRRFLAADVLAVRTPIGAEPIAIAVRAAVWHAAVDQLLRAAEADLGPDSERAVAFRRARAELAVARSPRSETSDAPSVAEAGHELLR